MIRLLARLSALIPLFPALCAYAVEAAKDAPAEQASPAVVIGFLVLLVGGCVAYFVYLMKSKKDEKAEDRVNPSA